ncbi:MAG: penicillin-binding protein activator [Rickettsiales bacterium]|nr:penicillin-binding protein activator [Rickettsiales bacterium]
MPYRIISIILALFLVNSCVKYVEVPVSDPVKDREQFVIDYSIKKEQIARKFKDIAFDDKNEIKIALMLPLSGKYEKIGNEILNAATLAIFDNHDPRIVLKVFDTEGSDLKTIEATKEIISEGYQIIIGPVFSQNVAVMQPLIKDEDIFVFTFSNDIAIATENTFLLGIDFRQQIHRLINYTSGNDYTYYLSLLPANDFGSYAIQELRRSVEKNNGVVLKSEFYTQGVALSQNVKRLLNVANESPTDNTGRPLFMNQEQLDEYYENSQQEVSEVVEDNLVEVDSIGDLVEVKDTDEEILVEETYAPKLFDEYKLILFIPDGGKVLEDTISLLEQYNFPKDRIKIVGISNWYNSSALKSKTLNDSWFVDIPHDNLKLYEEHYLNSFNSKSSRLSAYAYDAVSVITALFAYSDDADDFGNLTITQDIGFNGINGVFKFRPDGISERLLSVYSVNNSNLEQIDSEFSFLQNKELIDEITLD